MTWHELAPVAKSGTQQNMFQDNISCSHRILVSHPCLARPGQAKSGHLYVQPCTVLHPPIHPILNSTLSSSTSPSPSPYQYEGLSPVKPASADASPESSRFLCPAS
jgi:hypothetical protein